MRSRRRQHSQRVLMGGHTIRVPRERAPTTVTPEMVAFDKAIVDAMANAEPDDPGEPDEITKEAMIKALDEEMGWVPVIKEPEPPKPKPTSAERRKAVAKRCAIPGFIALGMVGTAVAMFGPLATLALAGLAGLISMAALLAVSVAHSAITDMIIAHQARKRYREEEGDE